MVINMKSLKQFLLSTIGSLLTASSAMAYPLDGYDETNINRLDGFFHSLLTDDGLKNLSAGSLLSITELKLQKPGLNYIPSEDRRLKAALMNIVPSGASVSVLNLSNPKSPQYAGINDNSSFVPGSVGKIMVAVSLFDALARMHPRSIKDREEILREKFIVANDYIDTDEHDVPFWDEQNRKVYFRPIMHGERANLWTYLDWMLSASSNAATSMVMREVLSMNHFKENYPPSASEEARFFASSAPQAIMQESFARPMAAQGFGGGRLFQGSFFTKKAKSTISGIGSSATTKDLLQLLLRMEEGKLVDEFSSLELKRLLYLTQHRERYVGTSVLDDAAVYFKAGSLHKCSGSCEKYEGNVQNVLNGLTIVEYPVGDKKLYYMVALSTNVLRQNAERLHQRIATGIQNLLMAGRY